VHTWPAPHVLHVDPPAPQAPPLVPLWHAPLRQHPDAQLLGEQPPGFNGAHAWFVHARPVPQPMQPLPPVPHAEFDVPSSHTLPLQQPDGHDCALQPIGIGAHAWL